MRLHADPLERIVLHTPDLAWSASPSPGVRRRMLDRIGAENAVATSIVEYAPGSRFPPHPHPGGEELFEIGATRMTLRGDVSTEYLAAIVTAAARAC